MGSNAVIINGVSVQVPEGINCTNYVDEEDLEPTFKCKERKKKLVNFVLHETAGRSGDQCKRTLTKRKLGVHLILDRNGDLSCHNDLAIETVSHAKGLNGRSIGIEIVNPYAPKIGYKGAKYETIPAKWWTWCPDKKDRRYILPTKIQFEVLCKLTPWLCDQLDIPYEFPTWYFSKKKRKDFAFNIKPGIVAHRDFGKHADGRYPLEYLIMDNIINEQFSFMDLE